MGYTALTHTSKPKNYAKNSLEDAALTFIRERCEGLRFDAEKGEQLLGKSLRENQIPYNMEMDIDRLCLENAVVRFLHSGKKEDAFDVYFCYLTMFVGDYDKTRRMIELLSEFEVNGSELLMKHRDHYVHSVYVFVLGLSIYETNKSYRETYKEYYHLEDEHKAAGHYLQYWGLASLFHDIGYPFELPFEQVASYFEVSGEKRKNSPFVAYQAMGRLTAIDGAHASTDELFGHLIAEKLGHVYGITEEDMAKALKERPSQPDKSNYFMDHAYFSATILYRKLFVEMECEITEEYLDALTAILLHNSFYKFEVTNIRSETNIPFKKELHPLAYMLMLCDELQCWDRTSYGRNSKKELHPMGCSFEFTEEGLVATYLFDKKEISKINRFKDAYIDWLASKEGKCPELKAYSKMYIKNTNGVTSFQEDIERIIDMEGIHLAIKTELAENVRAGRKNYLSNSNFLNLYNFALVLNGRWDSADWKKAKELGQEEQFLANEALIKKFAEAFKTLSLEYKLSNINQAKAFAGYMDEIGGFYSDKDVDFEYLEAFTEEDNLKIGVLEHQRWLQEHYDMGWEYGEPEKGERELVRLHKDMIPGFSNEEMSVSREAAKANYNRLDKAEQDKDTEPMECMLAMLKVFDGLRIYRL